jgi:pimeloyl-ACP methyl ester carboxylesterase
MPSSATPTLVLVHGLWADGSCWNAIIAPLQADGYRVISVQNPLTSLADDVAAVQRAIARAGGPVILVGHSWGGFVISAAGHDERVKALVYVAALGPDTGESLSSLGAKFQPMPIFSHLAVVDGYVWVESAGAKEFAGDLPQAQQDTMVATQGPANGAMLRSPLEGEPAWKSKPSWYLVASNDRTIDPEQERFMAQRMGATTVEVATSHVPMLSQPQAVVDLIRQAVQAAQ